MTIFYYPNASCLSTDTKPDSPNGATLVETDTGAWFVRTGGAWVPGTNEDLSGALDDLVSGGPGGAAWGDITGTLSAQTDLQAALDAKQATLVSGTNIKTVNGTTLLGSGDLVAGGGNVSNANSPNANEVARFTSATAIEGRTAAEFKADLDLEVGVDFPAVVHQHEFATIGADTAVNNAADQTIATRTVTGLVAGDQVVIEAFFTILNNSGATRVYTITLDFDGLFDIEFATGACAASATLMHPFMLKAALDIRSTSLCYAVATLMGQLAAGIASGGDVTIAATMLQNMSWATSGSNATGSTDVTLRCRSANNTATQTFRLHSLCVRKITPN